MSVPSPYASIPREQRPPGRRAKGRQVVPKGVKAAIAARGLAGESQAVLMREFQVSRDLVRRCIEQARTTDPEGVLAIKRALPDRFLISSFLSNEKAIEATLRDDAATATRWQFQAKLATESNRWADKVGDGGGTTMLELIKALNEVGGGSVTVAVGAGDAAPSEPTVIDVVSERLLTEGSPDAGA